MFVYFRYDFIFSDEKKKDFFEDSTNSILRIRTMLCLRLRNESGLKNDMTAFQSDRTLIPPQKMDRHQKEKKIVFPTLLNTNKSSKYISDRATRR